MMRKVRSFVEFALYSVRCYHMLTLYTRSASDVRTLRGGLSSFGELAKAPLSNYNGSVVAP